MERDLLKTTYSYIKARERHKSDLSKEIQMTRHRAVSTQMPGVK